MGPPAGRLKDEGIKVNPDSIHCSTQKDGQEGVLDENDMPSRAKSLTTGHHPKRKRQRMTRKHENENCEGPSVADMHSTRSDLLPPESIWLKAVIGSFKKHRPTHAMHCHCSHCLLLQSCSFSSHPAPPGECEQRLRTERT